VKSSTIGMRHPSPAARAIKNKPTPTTTAPMARATRSPAGARCSTVMATATTAITRRSMTPRPKRIAIRPAQQKLQWRPRLRPYRQAVPSKFDLSDMDLGYSPGTPPSRVRLICPDEEPVDVFTNLWSSVYLLFHLTDYHPGRGEEFVAKDWRVPGGGHPFAVKTYVQATISGPQQRHETTVMKIDHAPE
jgi:hypothetical protein